MKSYILIFTLSVVYITFANAFAHSFHGRSLVTSLSSNADNKFLRNELRIPGERYKRDIPTVDKPKVPEPEIYSIAITSNIRYRYAQTIISHRFANPANVSQEIGFTVNLPESAFISKFLMIIKDNVYEAYVKEKDEAKKDYQDAVDRGVSAGHVELNTRDSNVFTVSVNVEPLSKVTFNLTYDQLLKRTLGLYENVITINPGQLVKSLSVEVTIEEYSNITELDVPDFKTNNELETSSSQNKLAIIERLAGNATKITWKPTIEQQREMSESGIKGQFIVRYDVDRTSQPTQILVDEGYFVHFYAPSDLKTLPKHVIFTLDVSGSMQGRKIEQLREALLLIMGDITESDFFSLVLFSDSVELWSLNGSYGQASPSWSYGDEGPVRQRPEFEIDEKFVIPATRDNIAKAKQFAKTLNETGGTNIIAALRKSLELSQWGQNNNARGTEPLIIFLTDGEPNIEMSDPDEIVKAVRKQNTDNYAIFSLAFGEGADYNFLRKLSLSNNGFARNIYVASDTSLQLNNFYKQVASPLLSNVTFQYIPGQIEENSTTKAVFNNLFYGSELIVAGKLIDGTTNVTGNLSAHAVDGDFNLPFPEIIICLPAPDPSKPVNKSFGHLEKLWAYLYIQELLDLDAISDTKNNTHHEKALQLSLKYSFVTPLTSMVVVKPNDTETTGTAEKPSTSLESGTAQRVSIAAYPPMPYPPGLPGAYPMSGVVYTKQAASVASASYSVPSSLSLDAVDVSSLIESYPTQMSEDNIPIYTTVIRTTGLVNVTISEDYESGIISIPVPPTYLNVSDISWLNETLEVRFPSSNNTYSVASTDLPNMEFQICLLPDNKPAHCRHLAHCVLPNITKSFDDFLLYAEQCVIDARFVGICCPDTPETLSSLISNSTETEHTTSVILSL